jgi:hypothetical protein
MILLNLTLRNNHRVVFCQTAVDLSPVTPVIGERSFDLLLGQFIIALNNLLIPSCTEEVVTDDCPGVDSGSP